MVEFLNLKRVNAQYSEEFKKSFDRFLDSGHYILGKQVETFENEFAKYCGVKYCLGVANGLDALILILKAALELDKLQPGDEVLVPANTYIATILAIHLAGLKPVLVEPNLNTYNIDPKALKEKITKKTKAVMVVHLYGRLCDMTEIDQICKQNGLLLFEDSAQSHGATLDGKVAGSWGLASGFSFYPGKNLGALGDAGAITTNDENFKNVLLAIRNYGSHKKYVNDYIGLNSRLDEVQAGFLSIRLKNLERENLIRMNLAKNYDQKIENKVIIKPSLGKQKEHVWHLYTVRVQNREHFMKYLTENKVGSLIHYPIAPHHQKAYQQVIEEKNFPISEKIHQQVVSLPLDPTMTPTEIATVIEVVNKYTEIR